MLGLLAFLELNLLLSPTPNLFWVVQSIWERTIPLAVCGLAAAVVIAIGDIDLSVAGLMSMLGMGLVTCFHLRIPGAVALGLLLAGGALIGYLQGWLIGSLGIPPLVLTLGSSLALLGSAVFTAVLLRNSGFPGRVVEPAYVRSLFSSGGWWLALVLLAVVWWRYKTRDSLLHLAAGMDRSAAGMAALPVAALRGRAYLSSAVLTTLATILLLNYNLGGWNPREGVGFDLNGIAVAVIGGTRITGGRFMPLNVALGALLLRSAEAVTLTAPWITAEMQCSVVGVLVVLLAVVDRDRKR